MIEVDVENWDVAKNLREKHDEHLADEDDGRFTEVVFQDDTPDSVLEDARRQAQQILQEKEDKQGQVPLTDAEKQRIDFSEGNANILWARSIKGIAADEGVDDWTAHLDTSLTVDEHREVMERAAREGGGKRTDSEDSAVERAGRAARVAEAEECDHARGQCKNGDVEACEFLAETCGFDEDEVATILGQPLQDVDAGDDVETTQRELVTVGGDGRFTEMEVTPAEAGALSRSWQGYKGAINELENLLAEVRSAVIDARQASRAINNIREQSGEELLRWRRLRELLEALDELPQDIPETRTLDEFLQEDDVDEDVETEPDPEPLDEVPDIEPGGSLDDEDRIERFARNNPDASVVEALGALDLPPTERDRVEAVLEDADDGDDQDEGDVDVEDPGPGEAAAGRPLSDVQAVDLDRPREVSLRDEPDPQPDEPPERGIAGAMREAGADPEQVFQQRRDVETGRRLESDSGTFGAADAIRREILAELDSDDPNLERVQDSLRTAASQGYIDPNESDSIRLTIEGIADRDSQFQNLQLDQVAGRVEEAFTAGAADREPVDVEQSIGARPIDEGRGREVDVEDDSPLVIDSFQDAIDALEDASDGFGDRTEIDADLKRFLDSQGLEPSVYTERNSQDIVRYGIDAVDVRDRLEDSIEENPQADHDVELYVDAITRFARERFDAVDEPPDQDDDQDADALEQDAGDQFATERQSSLAVEAEAEDVAEDQQVTLTGDTANAQNQAKPPDWDETATRSGTTGPTRWDGGPYMVSVRQSDGGESWDVKLIGPENTLAVATGFELDTAQNIAEEFTDRIKPPDVSFHNKNRAVQTAVAEAKKEGIEQAGGGLGQFA